MTRKTKKRFVWCGTRYRVLVLLTLFFTVLSCSNIADNATDLGAAIIEDVDPGRVTIADHIQEYVMDSSALAERFSLPDSTNDTIFGVHAVASNSRLVIGARDGEHSAGHVQCTCRPDTASSRTFTSDDTLKRIVIRFSRDIADDTNPLPCRIQVWSSDDRSHALSPDPLRGDRLLDTLQFIKALQDSNNTTTIPDSIELFPDSLSNAIFSACTTSAKGSPATIVGFILANLDTGLIRLNGIPQLTICYRRASDTADRYRTYNFSSSCYIASDGSPDSLLTAPALSYASKRTAVFHYDAAPLWDTINAMPNTQHTQVLSAVFSLKGPNSGDTVKVRYLLLSYLEKDGAALDTLFSTNPSYPGVVTVAGESRVLAKVRESLQDLADNNRTPDLYLYLRLDEDVNQKWKKTVWNNTPLLSTTVAVP